MITTKKALAIIKKSKNIAIFAHKEPDPDACGSMFGLRDFCQKIGKNADVIMEEAPAAFMQNVFPCKEAVKTFSPEKYDLVVMTDLHDATRLNSSFVEKVQNFKNILIFDHHEVGANEKLITDNCIIKTVAAASMLIVDLFEEAKVEPSKDGATYLYAGIMGDTDRFLHTNLTEKVFENAIYLMKKGADIQKVYDSFYRNVSLKSIAVRKLLYRKMTYLRRGAGVYAIFTNRDIKRLGADIDDIKQYSNTMIRIEGVRVSFLIYQMPTGEFKVSMRTTDLDLVPFAQKMGGGGHKCASAFTTDLSDVEIKKKITSWCREILNG
ncbi:MAG: bifunctional oligoribonuclease/PAP phosphatase NrnA [Clostridia bacterium]|nr:bifunctional oligoribonuclease/PAP phosphatase NrnA [Clostridia bacterium]